MNDFGYSKAQAKYDSMLPERFESTPLFYCSYCGEDIYKGDGYFAIGEHCFCKECVERRIAEEEEYA